MSPEGVGLTGMTWQVYPGAILATAHRGLRSILATLAIVRLPWPVREDTSSYIVHPAMLMSTRAWS